MKKSKMISKKLIISALSTGMGVSLVGAITGTVAWYQYSTRSTVSFVGTSLASSKNLLISFDNSDYDNDLSDNELFLKAAFIQQISDGKILMRDEVHGLLENPQEESINWRRILE